MNRQQMAPQEQEPKRPWTRIPVSTSFISLLARLWQLIFWIWSILIIGIVVGVLGNGIFSVLTTGKINLTDTFIVITWLYTRVSLCLTIVTPILLITLCSYLAHRRKQQEAQKDQRVQDESLVIIAQGVQGALDKLNAQPVAPSAPPSPSGSVNEDTPSPKVIWNVPYRRNPFFTGRETLLQQLHDHFTQASTAALTQPQAITGLGGIGKTQLAVEYAYRHHDEYSYVLWVNAATREALLEGFIAIARVVDLPVKDEHDQRIVVEAVQRWLLLLDNADDLTFVHEFLPRCQQRAYPADHP